MMLSLTWLTTSVGEGENVTIDLKPFDAQREQARGASGEEE